METHIKRLLSNKHQHKELQHLANNRKLLLRPLLLNRHLHKHLCKMLQHLHNRISLQPIKLLPLNQQQLVHFHGINLLRLLLTRMLRHQDKLQSFKHQLLSLKLQLQLSQLLLLQSNQLFNRLFNQLHQLFKIYQIKLLQFSKVQQFKQTLLYPLQLPSQSKANQLLLLLNPL